MFAAAADDAVVEVTDQMLGVGNASLRIALAAIVEVDQRDLWRLDGAIGTEMWLVMRYGLSYATARERLRVARGLVFCPALAERFEAGHLSWDQLVACIDLVATGAMTDAGAAEDAVGRTAAELDRLAREARRVSRDESLQRQGRRYLRMRWDRDGMLRIHGRATEAEGKAIETVIRRMAQEQPTDPNGDVVRDFEERQLDALSDLASGRLAQDADPDLATVVVHVDAADLAREDDGLASIQLGPIVSVSTVQRLCCDGRIQVVLDDADGATISVSRVEHAIPRWMRRTVLQRDGGCRWLGCGRQALLHVHHIEWWSRGGRTEERNLCGLCPFHHRLVHEGGWRVEGDPFGRLRFVSPQGRVLEGGPPGLRDDVRDALGLRWSGDPPLTAA